MRILVVDDHPMIAEAVKGVAEEFDKSAQVELAGDLAGACARAGTEPALDLVLLDLGLPGCSGVQALAQFRERFPELPVVVFSGANDQASILAALDLGAMGFIPKSSPGKVVLNALKLVASGVIYVPVEALKWREAGSPPAAPPAAAARDDAPEDTVASEAERLGLSPRQYDVLTLLLQGLPNKSIARRLDISENTTKIHVSAVLHTLGVPNRTQALIEASRRGLKLNLERPAAPKSGGRPV